MWDYICPRCKREVPKKSHTCPHCREQYGVPLRVPPRVLKDPKALSDYVHKVLMPKVSAEMRMYLTNFFTVLFSDGFESGDFSQWTGTTVSGGNTLEVIAGAKHCGNYGAHSICTAWTGETYCYKTLASSHTTIYIRGYFYLNSVSQMSGYGTSLIEVVNSGGTNIARVGFYNDGGTTKLAVKIYGDSSWTVGSALSTGQWYCIETKLVFDASTGEQHVYLDGFEDITRTSLALITNAQTIHVGQVVLAGGHSSDTDVYVDCVVVADAYIGPEAAATLQTVADSLALSDAAYRNKRLVVADTSGLTDAILQNKTLVTIDSVGLADVELTGKIVVTADAVNFADTNSVNKILQVTETIYLVETVQVGVGSVKKTKLFLLLGDLAVQLTGE